MKFINYYFLVVLPFCFSCNNNPTKTISQQRKSDSSMSCMKVPSRFASASIDSTLKFNGDTSVAGMVFIKGGDFMMGGDNNQASADKYPKHKVHVDGFWMDATEVTNAQFQKFVEATNYVTTAEKKPD